jgi:hypothetical protein
MTASPSSFEQLSREIDDFDRRYPATDTGGPGLLAPLFAILGSSSGADSDCGAHSRAKYPTFGFVIGDAP